MKCITERCQNALNSCTSACKASVLDTEQLRLAQLRKLNMNNATRGSAWMTEFGDIVILATLLRVFGDQR
jgi:hypothetical protein